MSGKQKKRERGANYTPEEKSLLTDLIIQYKYVIEDKRTGGHIINKKKEAWKAITTKYNSNCTTGPRQTDQLKALYDNMKQKSRKNVGENNKLEYMNTLMQNTEDNVIVTNDDIAKALKHIRQDKVEVQKTGGGSWKPTVTDSDAKILAILQDQIEPLSNPYDSGAVYFKDNDEQENTESQAKIMELDSEPSAIEKISVQEKGKVTDTLFHEEAYYGDYNLSSPPDLQDTNSILVIPSKGVGVTPARRKLSKNKVVQKKIKKPTSAEALKRIYFKKKCQNAYLERKKLMQEILFNKTVHKLKITILKNKLDKMNK